MVFAAPLLGLVFVLTLPIAGLALIAWAAVKALARRRAAAAAVVKRTTLFVIAPFVGLVYLLTLPFVAIGMLTS